MNKKVILRVTNMKEQQTSIFIVDEESANSVIHVCNDCPVQMYLASKMDTESIPLYNNVDISDYARYFDIERVYECCNNIDPKCIHFLAEECAFVEEYCEYVLALCEKLAQDPQTVEIAKRIADTILKESIEILKEHMERTERNYHAFHNKIKQDTIEEVWDAPKPAEG